MIENVVKLQLPVHENLLIKRNRLQPEEGKENRGRISIVTGAHGDELEGQFVCYEIIRRIRKNPQLLRGTVDVYPVMNPLGMDSGMRTLPKIDMDLNRMFPGNQDGGMMDKMAAQLEASLLGSDICIDVHASDTFVKEIPQVRISDEFEKMMLPYAKHLNVDLIWINNTATDHEATLSYSLSKLGVPSLVIEMGLGNRINRKYGLQAVDGIFHLMKQMGLWDGEEIKTQTPRIVTNADIEFIRSSESGIFVPYEKNYGIVRKSDVLGEIIDPLRGKVLNRVKAGYDGMVFTMREHPVVYEGSLLARIIKGKEAAS
ncbi:MAG: succinylglutamate desuccinylase/aspartoacylase family protein [Lachnospiraceae bacterium]|nr:succinylglutamate desuccinylase/aspartoacylase family protein [Lachnospiraceae bacterium]